MASGPISMGDQLLVIYENINFTRYLSDVIAPYNVVINKPGFYVISINGSATSDNGAYWYGMCVIYNDPAGNYYCKSLGAMGAAGTFVPYIHQSNLIGTFMALNASNVVLSNTADWVNAPPYIGGGGFRLGAQGTYTDPVTVMIFHIG